VVFSPFVERAIDPSFLHHQYGTTERLQVRIETHQRYSERQDDFFNWVLDQLDPRPDASVLDVGCGVGAYHPALCSRGVRVVLGVDLSPAMVAASQRQADEQRLPVAAIEADAQHLPVPDDAYDLVMANHVLFHVPDQRAALRELRRVMKPMGRVILVTNAADHSQVLEALHQQAASQLGYTVSAAAIRPGSRFHLDHLALVQEIFPHAECRLRPDAFVFPDAHSALRYYASGLIDSLDTVPPDGSHRAPLLDLVGRQIESIVGREGVFRVPKSAGCFLVHGK
jgi:ubiquinone/menaquinone biosynthesis C-methylase UbiE